MTKLLKTFFITLFLAFSISSAFAEEAEEEAEAPSKEPLMYFQIDPNILTFYQNSGRKMGYIVVQIQVVVRGQDNYDMIELHMPLLQDALIDFFNRQDKKTVQDLKQREGLRQQATAKITAVLKEEVGEDVVENLLFTQYIFQ